MRWTKTPAEVIVREIDWSRLMLSGNQIASHSISVSPAAGALEVESTNYPAQTVMAISGGAVGQVYTVTVTATTGPVAEILERAFEVRVVESIQK